MTPLYPPAIDTALHATTASRAIEARALALHEPGELMARAGLAVARLAMALLPTGQRVWVFCGPGHNGGDGWVAARHLHGRGWAVRVIDCAQGGRLPRDAQAARTEALAAGVAALTQVPTDEPAPELVIDALLGLGQTRAPDEHIARAIAQINALPARVLAVDVPTGLADTTGARLGDDAVVASATLALLTAKPGLFTADGRDHAGCVWVDHLQCASAEPPSAWLTGRASAEAARLPRHHADHKGRFGDVWVMGGDARMPGAGTLAARAALAAGAGRVYLAGPSHASLPPDVMTPPASDWQAHAEHATLVAGCGGGPAVAAALPQAIDAAARLVLDADGLNALAASPALAARLAARTLPAVLTPHPLEAARLLGVGVARVQGDRLAAAQALAERLGCVVVLKGSGTVVAAPAALPYINPTGNARLAVPGSGDVLAGWLAGLWAQAPDAEPQRLAAAAVWWHGAAADHAGCGHMSASDLVTALGALPLPPAWPAPVAHAA